MESALIISNTTPLINFAEIGRMDVLRELFGTLVIPPAVATELDAIPLPRTLWAELKLLAQPDDMGWGKVLLAEAQLGQGQAAEALKTIESALAVYREMQVQGANHLGFRQRFAHALYVQALSQPSDAAGLEQRRASLAEAAKVLFELTEEARQLHDTKELLAWIAAEQTKLGPEPQP